MYVLAPNDEILKYPYSDRQLIRDNPDHSFPDVIDDNLREHFGMFKVSAAPKPEHGPKTLLAVEGSPVKVEGSWVQTWTIRPFTEQEIQQKRDSLKDAVTAKRWEVETGGLTLPDGVNIKTGIDDKNRITTVIVNAKLAGLTTVNFKAASGWVTLPLAAVKGIASAIAVHTDNCFTAEMNHHNAIDALPEEEIDNYDINVNWPSSSGED